MNTKYDLLIDLIELFEDDPFNPTLADELSELVYEFDRNNPAFGLKNYHKILKRKGCDGVPFTDVDVSKADAKCLLALFMALVRLDRFADRSLSDACQSGLVLRWLKRLREIRDSSLIYKIFNKKGSDSDRIDKKPLLRGKYYVNIDGKKLTGYSYCTAGSMSGGHQSVTIERTDDTHALVKTESAEWHNSELITAEYLVDASIMAELEETIRKYNMNNWCGRKFTDIFVCDGPSQSYSFTFEDKFVNFSSQIFPDKYGEALRELHKIIAKYTAEKQ